MTNNTMPQMCDVCGKKVNDAGLCQNVNGCPAYSTKPTPPKKRHTPDEEDYFDRETDGCGNHFSDADSGL